MIEVKHYRVECNECDGDLYVSHEDIYGHQYKIQYCPFCRSTNIEVEEETENEEF